MDQQTQLITLETVDSTNAWLRRQMADGAQLRHMTVVSATEQTAGRGQRGNSWEAEPGMNLTFSLLLRPREVPAADQFAISEAVALAVAEAVAPLLPAECQPVEVKWPNDIYVGNRKLAGILIENSLTGRMIDWSIAGVGINVNQRRFVSDAPNPVSVANLTGSTHELRSLLQAFADALARLLAMDRSSLHARYMGRLWRRAGLNLWRDTASGTIFEGSIADVALTGHLTIADGDGLQRRFAFKEIEAIL